MQFPGLKGVYPTEPWAPAPSESSGSTSHQPYHHDQCQKTSAGSPFLNKQQERKNERKENERGKKKK